MGVSGFGDGPKAKVVGVLSSGFFRAGVLHADLLQPVHDQPPHPLEQARLSSAPEAFSPAERWPRIGVSLRIGMELGPRFEQSSKFMQELSRD